jgi:membrane protein DedA with SNARE-associated domain
MLFVDLGFGYTVGRMLKAIIASLKTWYFGALKTGGYWVVGLMMAIESSLFPLPSEIVIPPAAYWAHTHDIPLSLPGIIIAGTIGSWVGAACMYWASRWAGRPLVMRFGRFVMISPAKVEGAERWAAHYGSMGIFISRLLPVVRHLIGIPAGIVRMNFTTFSLYTLLGSAVWCSVLCYVGIKAGNDENLMKGEMHALTFWLGGAMVILGSLYYFMVHRHMKSAAPQGDSPKK